MKKIVLSSVLIMLVSGCSDNTNVKKVAEKSFGVSVSDDSVLLPGVVSRKKQIIPNLKL